MPITLDHIIVPVNDLGESLHFYTQILGFEHDGDREPFTNIRVSPDFMILLAPWGSAGGKHLAFSMRQAEFEVIFQRIRDEGLAYGDQFDQSDNMKGPGDADGARGDTKSLYCMDPNKHLLEFIYYLREA